MSIRKMTLESLQRNYTPIFEPGLYEAKVTRSNPFTRESGETGFLINTRLVNGLKLDEIEIDQDGQPIHTSVPTLSFFSTTEFASGLICEMQVETVENKNNEQVLALTAINLKKPTIPSKSAWGSFLKSVQPTDTVFEEDEQAKPAVQGKAKPAVQGKAKPVKSKETE